MFSKLFKIRPNVFVNYFGIKKLAISGLVVIVLFSFIFYCGTTDPVKPDPGTSSNCGETLFSSTKYGLSFTYCESFLTYILLNSMLSNNPIYFVQICQMKHEGNNTSGLIDVCVSWPIQTSNSASRLISIAKSNLDSNYLFISCDSSRINGYLAGKVNYSYIMNGKLIQNVWILILSHSALYQINLSCEDAELDTYKSIVLNRIYSTINIDNGTAMDKSSVAEQNINLDDILKNSFTNHNINVKNEIPEY